VKTAEEATTDLTTLLIRMKNFRKVLYSLQQSLMVANFGLSALKAIENNKLKLTLEVKFC